MRFLILTQYFPPEIGAPQTRLAALARELVSQGHGVEVITAMPNYPSGQVFPAYRGSVYRRDVWEGIPVHRVWLYSSAGAGVKRLVSYLSFTVTAILGVLQAAKPDYIFVESPPISLSLPAFAASRLWGVPFIFNVADVWPDAVTDLGVVTDGGWVRAARWLEQWSYHHAAYVTAVTDGVRATLIHEKGVPPDKVLFLPNGVDTELFKPGDPDPNFIRQLGLAGKKIVLYAGNHGFAQALDHTLLAARLLQADPTIHFLFVGDGSEKTRLMQLAQTWNLRNVTFMAPVPLNQLPPVVRAAYCGVISLRKGPTFDGTRPAKTYALMACAKPIVLAANGEAARLIADAGAGTIVPPENPEALAQAIRALASDATQAIAMGRNGRMFVQKNLQWRVLIQEWLGQLTHTVQARAREAVRGAS